MKLPTGEHRTERKLPPQTELRCLIPFRFSTGLKSRKIACSVHIYVHSTLRSYCTGIRRYVNVWEAYQLRRTIDHLWTVVHVVTKKDGKIPINSLIFESQRNIWRSITYSLTFTPRSVKEYVNPMPCPTKSWPHPHIFIYNKGK